MQIELLIAIQSSFVIIAITVLSFMLAKFQNSFSKSLNVIIKTIKDFSTELNRSKYETELQSRDCIRKLSDFINSHMWNFKSKLFEEIKENIRPFGGEELNIELILDVITSDLQYKLLNNFTENHIGNTDEEIAIYTRIRTKEYMMRVISIVNEYSASMFENTDFSTYMKSLPDSYLYDKLYLIYRDGKTLEKSIKSEFKK